jgi:hypothetical protein
MSAPEAVGRPRSGEPAPAPALRWWREVLYIVGFYLVYTTIRDTQGSAGKGKTAPSTTALRHAHDVIRIEKDLLIFHEHQIQHFFIAHFPTLFFQFWNLWYGSAHFVVTAGVVIWLFRRHPERYQYWRNTLAIVTALALVGFALFPLMPPRLLPFNQYGFVDTLARYGGSWSFDSGAMNKVSNQFAAMPSLHIGWSSYCCAAVYPSCKKVWTKVVAFAYPVVTLFCIVVTANHYFLDAAGGLFILALGSQLSRGLTGLITTWSHSRRTTPA